MKNGGLHFLSRFAPFYGPHFGVAAQGCLRGMGLIYIVSFWSLAAQLPALSGSSGLMPAEVILHLFRQISGAWAPLHFPSLFWIYPHPIMILLLSGLGTLAGLGLLYGFFPWFSALLSWICWVSLLQVCQPWMSVPGDHLTAEIGLILLLLVPPFCRGYPPVHRMGSRITGIVLMNAVLFKILFSSGLAKLAFGDENWGQGTAFYHFFETQNFPAATAWFVHNFPGTLLKYALWGLMFIELILPFYVFLPRTFRNILAGAVGVDSLILLITGQHGFLPFLLLILAFSMVDDVSWRKILPPTWAPPAAISLHQPGLFSLLLLVSLLPLMIWQTHLKNPGDLPRPWKWLDQALSNVHASNRYALFHSVEEKRTELSIQGSMDGRSWIEYRFRLKPTDPSTLPLVPDLHLPRLDLAFVQLGRSVDQKTQTVPPVWLIRLMEQLLVNDPATLSLFPVNPFPDHPPKYLRLALYEYHFADPVTRREESVWWERKFLGFYGPVFTRDSQPTAGPSPALIPPAPASPE